MKITRMASSVLMASLVVVGPAIAQEMPLPPKPGGSPPLAEPASPVAPVPALGAARPKS